MRSDRSNAILFCLLAAVLPAMPAAAGDGKIHHNPKAVKGEYIVVLKDNTPREQVPAVAQNLAKAHGGALERVWQDAIKGFFIRLPEQAAIALSRDPEVDYVEENAEAFLSDRVSTYVDPACDTQPCGTADNRLWHLDIIDQDTPVPSGNFGFCSTGSGVYVYVVDTGVMRAHREFNNDATKVVDGYNATGDGSYFPAWDPCHGLTSGSMPDHGTGIGSLVAGRNVGVARGATIVPVKVAPCGSLAAQPLQRNHAYAVNDIVAANGAYYICVTAGTTGSTPPTTWSWPPTDCCTYDGTAVFSYYHMPTGETTQMIIDGVNWILSANNPNPKAYAVATFSTYSLAGDSQVTALETAVRNLIKANITVTASANNQNGNACDTSPSRISRGNPNNTNDPNVPYKVITAGGVMLTNNPDGPPNVANPANGGSQVQATEPAYDGSSPTSIARWRCGHGDSDNCTANALVSSPPTPPNPSTNPTGYIGTTLGSNGGVCVTMFAAAKNVPVAAGTSLTAYRDSRSAAGWASGTSWSAPIIAGVAARILQNAPTSTPDDVYNTLMNNAVYNLIDSYQLDPPGVTGTPNVLLHTGDVWINTQPPNTPANDNSATQVTVAAQGNTALSYQWYQVGDAFDINDYHNHCANATALAGQTSATLSITPTARKGYFVRVTSSCATTDSNIAVIPVRPSQPVHLTATYDGSTGRVTVNYDSSANAQEYSVDRWTSSGGWQLDAIGTGYPGWGYGPPLTSLPDYGPPHPSDGVVVYRVRAGAGGLDLPAAQILYSPYSHLDFAFTNPFTDNNLIVNGTLLKAIHLIELRTAVNAAAAAAGLPAEYADASLQLSSLLGQAVTANDLIDLQTHLNHVRTNAAYGLAAVSFVIQPVSGGLTRASAVENLRDGLR